MNASKCAAYNTYVVPRHRLSDNGGTHSQLIEDKLVVHWMMNATSEPMPADSHQVKWVQIAPEESNPSTRTPQTCNAFFLLVKCFYQADVVTSQGVQHLLTASQKQASHCTCCMICSSCLTDWQCKALVGLDGTAAQPYTGTESHTSGLEFCPWTSNSQQRRGIKVFLVGTDFLRVTVWAFRELHLWNYC